MKRGKKEGKTEVGKSILCICWLQKMMRNPLNDLREMYTKLVRGPVTYLFVNGIKNKTDFFPINMPNLEC